MKCPHCKTEIRAPLFSFGLKITCPECEGSLVEFERVFTGEELEKFYRIIEQAIEDPGYCQELLQAPERKLEEAGISPDTISYLQKVTFEVIRTMDLPPLAFST